MAYTVSKKSDIWVIWHGFFDSVDVNGFFSVKLQKQTKNCSNISEGPIKILGTEVSSGRAVTGSRGFYTPQSAKQRTFAAHLTILRIKHQSDIQFTFKSY